MRQLGEDDLPHRQLDRRARARHHQDHQLAHQAADGPAQEARRADLGVAQHPEQLAVSRQRLGQKRETVSNV